MKIRRMIIWNGNNAGILIVYLVVDAGNIKREGFYLLRNLPFFKMKKITSKALILEACCSAIMVSMGFFYRGKTIKFMIMTAISIRYGRACYPLYLVSMSVINRSKGKISMGMRDPSRCRFGLSSVLMAMSIIKRCYAAKSMRMNGPSIPGSYIKSMGMHWV
jgi:hypothetical protein